MAQFRYTRSNVIRFTLGDKDYCLEQGNTYELPENEQYIKTLLATEQIERVEGEKLNPKATKPEETKEPAKKTIKEGKEKAAEKTSSETSTANTTDNETKQS